MSVWSGPMSGAHEVESIELSDRRFNERVETTSLLVSPMSGTVTNISPTGIGLETWDPLPVQSKFVITIGQLRKQARLACGVVWCRLVRTEKTEDGTVLPIYRSGLRFLSSDELPGLPGVGQQ